MGAAPAGGEQTWLRALGRPWVSVRAHYGALPLMWLDGDRQRREIVVSQVPGSADQGYYAVTERREALPCASVFRRSGKQAAAVTKVRLSAFRLPLNSEGGPLKPPFTRRDLRAAMTLAWRKERCDVHNLSPRRPRQRVRLLPAR